MWQIHPNVSVVQIYNTPQPLAPHVPLAAYYPTVGHGAWRGRTKSGREEIRGSRNMGR